MIISGQRFGTRPTGQLDNSTTCGNYTNNGDAFGASNPWFKDGIDFVAGIGTPPSASCIGIIVESWSSDQIIYQFGNAYDTFDHWYISPGDQYTVSVMGVQYTGTIGFS